MNVNGTVISREEVGDGAAIVRIQPDGGVPPFKAGQHMAVGWTLNGVMSVKPYSIASAPSAPFIELYAQDAPSGRVVLPERGSGSLTLDEVPADRDLLMIATGTGISPFMSILRAHQRQWHSFTLVHGVRFARDLAYRAELERAPITYVPVVSREPFTRTGRVQAALELDPRDRERTHVFLCGNGMMVRELEALLTAEGFTHIHMEKYA